jgi:hypothetical protein
MAMLEKTQTRETQMAQTAVRAGLVVDTPCLAKA